MYNENENNNENQMNSGMNTGASQQTDTNNSASQESSSTQDTTYRYDRSYYEQNRDENNSYQYNQNSSSQYNSTDSSQNGSYQYNDSGNNGSYQYNTTDNGNNGSYQYNDNGNNGSYQYNNAQYQQYSQTVENSKEAKKRAKKMKKQQKAAKRNAKASKLALAAAGLVAVAAVSMGTTYASLQLFGNDTENQVVIQSTSTNANTTKTSKVSTTNSGSTVVTTDVSSMVSEVMPSVVTISNIGTETYSSFFGQSGTYEYSSSGSGIIAGQSDSELLIVTNHHVISGADTINVTFVDGKTYQADVKGSDSTIDIAVIAISLDEVESETLNQIKVATLGDSLKLSVGEPAIAIGNAMGYGQSVTTGVISALDREVTVDNVTNTLIQTDAAINPGNSGGALLNLAGEVIGINSVKYASTEVEGMGYAIPISDVTDVINDMMNKETKKKVDESQAGYLGIKAVEINSSVSQTYNMPQGIYVAGVDEGGAAEKAGIKKGDIITKIAGTTVTSSDDLTSELEYHEAGSTVEIVVQSPVEKGYGYEEKTYEVTLDEKPE